MCPKISTTVTAAELTFGVAEDITADTLTLTLKRANTLLDAAAALQNSETMAANASSTAGIGFIGAPIREDRTCDSGTL